MVQVQTTLVASPRNHRELTPRDRCSREVSFVRGAEGEDLSHVTIKHGVDALAFATRVHLDAVDEGAEHVYRFLFDLRVIQRPFKIPDFVGINLSKPRMQTDSRWGTLG